MLRFSKKIIYMFLNIYLIYIITLFYFFFFFCFNPGPAMTKWSTVTYVMRRSPHHRFLMFMSLPIDTSKMKRNLSTDINVDGTSNKREFPSVCLSFLYIFHSLFFFFFLSKKKRKAFLIFYIKLHISSFLHTSKKELHSFSPSIILFYLHIKWLLL